MYTDVLYYTVLYIIVLYGTVLTIGPLNPAIHGIRVASVIEFSVCLFCDIFSTAV